MKKEYIEESKKLKDLVILYDTCDDIFNALDLLYERISNKVDTNYSRDYNLMDIITSKKIITFEKKLKDNKSIVISLVKYKNAPNNLLIEYNEFVGKSDIPIRWEYYILKGERENENIK